jgi:hypothetical protein
MKELRNSSFLVPGIDITAFLKKKIVLALVISQLSFICRFDSTFEYFFENYSKELHDTVKNGTLG